MILLELEDIEKLIQEQGDAIYGFCRKLTMNKEDADDLYQQTFLKVVEIREKIRNNHNPKGFLIAISISIWKNSIRKKARHNRIAPTINIEDNSSLGILDNGIDIEKQVINNELQHQVNIIVSNLKDRFRIPVIMHYNAELSIEDIAISLKIPNGTVKSRLHKARLIIKDELEVMGYEGWK